MFCCIAAPQNTGVVGAGVDAVVCVGHAAEACCVLGGNQIVVDHVFWFVELLQYPRLAIAFAVHIAPLPVGNTIVFQETVPPVFIAIALSWFFFLIAATFTMYVLCYVKLDCCYYYNSVYLGCVDW